MSLQSQEIPNLVAGVSQQDDKLRRASQCEEQVNCKNSLVDGMGKRMNSVLKAKLDGLTNDAAVFHSIKRDDNEKYIVVVQSGSIKVFDTETGYEYPVVLNGATADYIKYRRFDYAHAQIQLMTVADSTFILNKHVAVQHKE